MSSEVILGKVQTYLAGLHKGQGKEVPFSLTGEFASITTGALKRQLSPDAKREFRLRMSNLGRPGCILQSEKLGLPSEPRKYSDRFRNLYGDLIEASAVATMELAGVNVKSKQTGVSLEIAGQTIDGTYDLIIAEPDDKLYDVKSASGYTFRNHYMGHNLKSLWDDGDSFGYVSQIYLYAQALKIPVGGLIVINKEDGSWCVVEPPVNDDQLKLMALSRAANNVVRLVSNKPFSKDFKPIEETYRKKKTGNTVLAPTCGFCDYRKNCWPEAQLLPQLPSKGANPRPTWYVTVADEYKDKNGKEE